MTAIQKQTVKVYLINFEGCTTRAGFWARIARAFGLGASIIFDGQGWTTLCARMAKLTKCGYSVRIQIRGLEALHPILPNESQNLLRILRAASDHADDLRAEAIIGNAKWKI